jgi:hypothetical protein
MAWLFIALASAGGGFASWNFLRSRDEIVWSRHVNGRSFRKRPKRQRNGRLLSDLADFLDLLAMGLSSSLDLSGSWRHAVSFVKDDFLRRELEWVEEVTRLGKSRENAFEELGTRLGVPSLRLFFAILVQSLKTGSRLQVLLHEQAHSLRQSRMMELERRAGIVVQPEQCAGGGEQNQGQDQAFHRLSETMRVVSQRQSAL